MKGFAPEKWLEKKKVKEGDTFIHLSIAASRMAVEGAHFEPTDEQRERIGTIIGVGLGGLDFIEKTAKVLNEKGPNRVTPYFIPATIANLAAGQVSMIYGFKGANFSTTSACASGRPRHRRSVPRDPPRVHGRVRRGRRRIVHHAAVRSRASRRCARSRRETTSRSARAVPSTATATVSCIGEGAGIVLLEEREAAMRRGAHIYAELVGYAATADAYHLTQPAPEAEGAQRAMRDAIARREHQRGRRRLRQRPRHVHAASAT